MTYTTWVSLVCLFLIANCLNIISQEIGNRNTNREINNGIYKMIHDKEIEFIDNNISTIINTHVNASVTFNHLTSKPTNTFIHLIKMSEENKDSREKKIDFTFFFDGSKENNLNVDEWILLEKYLPKVDSIFMNSQYEFIGKKKSIFSNRMSILLSFKIKPE